MSAAAIQTETTNAGAAKGALPKLKLYLVTSPWHPRDREMGTYCDKVWARDSNDAARELALLMAQEEDSSCETDEEMAAWAKKHLEGCKDYMDIVDVSATVVNDIRELLAGPEGELEPGAKSDFEAIKKLLAKYTKPR
jgi:hypothetical protein